MDAPKIKQRVVNQDHYQILVEKGLDPVIAKIVAARPRSEKIDPMATIEPKLQYLDNPFELKDCEKAVARLITAIQNKEIIGFETDHDCDGQTSHAVLVTAFTEILGYSKTYIRSYIGHRMKEGYGLSDTVADRILADEPMPTVVITADNGSADEPRIARLKAAGIDVIVTDHHELPADGPPKSAFACLNPTRDDCDFPDPYIAGCMVAWLLMAAVRRKMIEQNLLPFDAPSMARCLDYVAVGTVADCVSMARSVNNRAVVQYGLKRIAQGVRPCWQAVLPLIRRPQINSEDLGFLVGPLLNSDGRLSDAFGSVNFLLSANIEEANPWAKSLWKQNETRKGIQKEITNQAMKLAQAQVNAGKRSIVVYLPEGHAGIHGISASRIKDAFGRPVIIFSPKEGEEDIITGSARSIDDLHIKEALDETKVLLPEVVVKYGGHSGAAGVAILKKGFDDFVAAFEKVVAGLIDDSQVGAEILTDGELPQDHTCLQFLDQLQKLEPFGREFEAPVFEIEAQVVQARAVGQDGTHLQLKLKLSNGDVIPAIFFGGAQDRDVDALVNQQMRCTAQLADNHFRGRELQLMVKSLELAS